MDLDHFAATDKDIVNWCSSYRRNRSPYISNDRLLGTYTSNLVLRLNEQAVVKFGYSVTASEAANQRLAYQFLNGESLRIPQVYRFFQDTSLPDSHWRGKCGYLVMEFIQGTQLSEIPLEELSRYCDKLARAITEMLLVESDRPGPADGGEPQGNIWAPDYRAYERFKTIDDLEAWFNRALVKEGTRIRFPSARLPFCHLDLSRRNVIIMPDESLALIDWADAGFYPTSILIWSLNAEVNDQIFVDALLEKLPRFTMEEKSTLRLLERAYFWNSLNGL